jgi:hypothetical protein
MVSAKFIITAAIALVAASARPLNVKQQIDARDFHVLDGFKSSVTISKQVVDALSHQLKSHDGHASAEVLLATITGLDAQIDNAAGTVSHALAPFTGNLSLAVGNFLLGPFFQSVTNGAEVLLSNIVGGAVDGVSAPAVAALSGNINKLTSQAARYHINTEKLVNLNKELQNHIPKH